MEGEKKQGFTCSGDCLSCNAAQRQYCASQNAYNTMRMVQEMRVTIDELAEKIRAIESSEALVFAPSAVEDDTAQEASGAGE